MTVGALGRLTQIAYLVDDLDAAARRYARDLGAGPFLVRRDIVSTDVRHGGDGAYTHSAAYGQWGPVMLELIDVHDVRPPEVADALLSLRSGIHHVANFVDDLDIASAAHEAAGHPLIMDLRTSSGMAVHFHDARHSLGHFIELYEPTEHLLAHYRRVEQAAIGWDGIDPVRSL
jgi:glyoxalase/bleomycin resistance protein/dioxygenase superfamily protein